MSGVGNTPDPATERELLTDALHQLVEHLGGHVHQGDHPTHGQNRIAGRDPVSRPTVTDELIRAALLPVLRNAGNYPRRIQHLILGEDLTDLIALAVSAVSEAVAAPAPDRDELVPFIVDILDRGNYVRDWPEDERELHRRGDWDSFDERHRAVAELRARKIIAAVAGVGGVPAEPQPADHAIDVHRVPGPGLHPDYYAACICGWRGTNRIASDLARSEGTEHLAGAVPQDREAGQ